MTETPGVAALREHNSRQSQAKRQRVVSAIAEAARDGTPCTVTLIARVASVSREFIYSHPDLIAALRRAKSASQGGPLLRNNVPPREAALLAERATLIAQVNKKQDQLEAAHHAIEQFEKQHERLLGAQLDQLMQPARLEELTSENEHLTRRLIELTRINEAQERSIRILEHDLKVSRLAHSETAAELADSNRVIPLRPVNPEDA
jgi:hypothetical protein